jgi:hypothetical protein
MPKLLTAFAIATMVIATSGVWKSQRGDHNQCWNSGTSNEILYAR